MEDRCLESRREDFPPHSGSHLLCDLGRVSFTSAGQMLPRCNSSAGTPMAVQGLGSAPGTGWGGWPVPLHSAGSMCVPHPRRPLHLWGAEKQSKKFISRKQTQMYQPSSCITSVARNEVPEGKKCKENKPRNSLSPLPTSASGCCWLGSQDMSKNSWRVLIPLSRLPLMGMEQPLAQEVLNSPALWMSL